MSSTPEGKLKYKIKKFLDTKKPDLWWDSPVRNGYGRSGPPDIHGCYKGFFFGIETKVPGKEPTPWQQRELGLIRDARGYTIVCGDFETFLTCFTDFTSLADKWVIALEDICTATPR